MSGTLLVLLFDVEPLSIRISDRIRNVLPVWRGPKRKWDF
jgi:hypothetical protein